MTIAIRPGLESDISFILKAASVTDSIATIKQRRGVTAEHLRKDIFCDQPKAYIAIATIDAEPVASFIYSFFYLGSVGQVIWVSKVYIDPFCRKMNIGALMRNYLFRTYPEVPALYGSVVPNNKTARLFFNSLGAHALNEDYIFYKLENPVGPGV